MSWVKIDDKFPEHLKVTGLSDAAFRLYVSALCYANRQETDGFVPRAQVPLLVRTRGEGQIAELLAAGLWSSVQAGYSIHDYLLYQPSHADLDRSRQMRAEAGRRGGLRSGQVRRAPRSSDPETAVVDAKPGSADEANLNPVPRAVPVPEPVSTNVERDAEDGDAHGDVVDRCLASLQGVHGYRSDPTRDRALIGEFVTRKPEVDWVEEIRKLATWVLDKPLGPNPSFELRRWLGNAIGYEKRQAEEESA